MNKKMKSLMLSRILVAAMFVFLVVMLICIPFFSKWFDRMFDGFGIFKGSVFIPVCIMLYICEIFAFIAIASLNRLLKNISADNVFSEENAKCLGVISWACMLAGVTFSVFSPWRIKFLIAAFFAVFLGLILRVLKNVFDKAVEIKSENDYTV